MKLCINMWQTFQDTPCHPCMNVNPRNKLKTKHFKSKEDSEWHHVTHKIKPYTIFLKLRTCFMNKWNERVSIHNTVVGYLALMVNTKVQILIF